MNAAAAAGAREHPRSAHRRRMRLEEEVKQIERGAIGHFV
jgi:hypothetical protein